MNDWTKNTRHKKNAIIIEEFQEFWKKNNIMPSDTSILNVASFVFNEQRVTFGFEVWRKSKKEYQRLYNVAFD